MVPPRRDTSEASLMSVAEMIDTAFGNDDEENIVDFGSIHAILLILARSLCVLDRQVAVKLPYTQMVSQSDNITINEIKVSVKNENRIKDQNAITGVPDHHVATKLKISPDKTSGQNDKSIADDDKKDVFSTQIFYVVVERASSNKHQRISNNKTVASTGDNTRTLNDHVFSEKYLISSEEESNEYMRKKHKKAVSNDLTTNSSTKSQDVKRKPADLANTTETHQEKILIVGRRPSTETALLKSSTNDRSFEETTQTLVTREQYNKLNDDITKLQQLYDSVNPKLYERTSLSDPMAVLQISARLETVERAISEMTEFLNNALVVPFVSKAQKWETSLANLILLAEKDMKSNLSLQLNIKVLRKSQVPSTILLKYDSGETSKDFKHDVPKTRRESNLESTVSSTELYVASEELRYRRTHFAEEMAKTIQKLVFNITFKAESTLQNRTLADGKLTKTLQNLSTLEALENDINHFTNTINKTDITLSKITTQYSEELAAMETEISRKLENLADALSRQVPVNDMIPELVNKFMLFFKDIKETNGYQDELHDTQSKLFDKIKILEKQLNELQRVKANRDDVEKAIESKINRSTINGIVTKIQFYAVLANWHDHIKKIFNKMRGQEVHWQEQVNTLWTKIDELVDRVHVDALKEDIKKHIAMLNEKLDFMLDLCNENDASAVRVLHQSCICCDTVEKDNVYKHLSAKPQQQANTQASKTTRDKLVCFHNLPVPCSLATRTKTCEKCVGFQKTRSDFHTMQSLTSGLASRTESVSKHKDIITPCKECYVSKHEIVKLPPANNAPKPKATSLKQTKQSDKPQRTTRGSIASDKSKHSHASLRLHKPKTKRSFDHFRDSVSEESEVEPVLIVLEDD